MKTVEVGYFDPVVLHTRLTARSTWTNSREFLGPGLIIQITDYRLQITNYRIQITNYRLQIIDYRLQISDYRLQIGAGYMYESRMSV